VRDQAGLTDGQLGTALLFVGLGALPAMLLTGPAVDRFGRRVPAAALIALGLAGLLVAATARGPVSLSIGLTVLGATSGAADVAINTVAVDLERATGRPVITRAHGSFSTAVVAGSLLTGLLAGIGAPMTVAFGAAAAVAVVAAVPLLTRVPPAAPGPDVPSVPADGGVPRRGLLVLVGVVAALAFAVENAHQSWGAVYLGDVLSVPLGLTALAPAVFAGVVAVTRFAVGVRRDVPLLPLLLGGSGAAAAGTVLLAVAPNAGLALLGLALAAAGTAVLFPTLLKGGVGHLDEGIRGRATSLVSTTAYLGFLLGPVYVGQLSEAVDLRGAMLGVAALAVLFAVVVRPVLVRVRS
jgi:MFS family permease